MQVQRDQHSTELVENINYLLNAGALHDVTLCSADGGKIKAHRLVLAATSTYFRVSEYMNFSATDRNIIVYRSQDNVNSHVFQFAISLGYPHIR